MLFRSVYYGSEWGIEGKRSRTSDEVLRPALNLSDMPGKAPELASHIAAPGKIHTENDAFHNGSYKELLLTNRQYAFSRSGEHGTVISAVNNDEQPASISIPLPCAASDVVSPAARRDPILPRKRQTFRHAPGKRRRDL